MSKASEFSTARTVVEARRPSRFTAYGRWAIEASVTDEGGCSIRPIKFAYCELESEAALALARWILDTFGEEEK